jgi:hypothetical protein
MVLNCIRHWYSNSNIIEIIHVVFMINFSNLLSCPFCGNDARMADLKTYFETSYFVVCTKCQGKIGPYKNKYEAAKLWNKRIETICI